MLVCSRFCHISFILSLRPILYSSFTIDFFVTIGAAPGNHIPYLATTLFPFVHFDLYDPALFDFECNTIPNVTIYNDFFRNDNIEKYTTCDATKIAKSKLLFIHFGFLH